MKALRVLLVVAVTLAILLVAAFPLDFPAASRPERVARTVGAGAGAVVSRKLSRSLPSERRVRCRRVTRARSARAVHRCVWRGSRRLSPNRTRACRGRARVARRAGTVRARITRRHCALRVKALAPRFGFHDNSVAGARATPAQLARLVEGTGAGMYRTLLDWRSLEPAPNVYDWSLADGIYREMTARGVKPLFLLAWAPQWAWGRDVSCTGPHCHLPPAPEFYGEWREIAALLATRYPKAAGIEIWNEPNESTAWNFRSDPRRYTELLREAHGAIKSANPRMHVISGGLSNRFVSDATSHSVMDFARGLVDHGGLDYLDAIGLHPYVPPDGLDLLYRPLDQVRALARTGKPIWATEVGTSTSGGPLGATLREQSSTAVRVFDRFARDPQVGALLVHTLIDPRPEHVPPEDVGFGVLRGDLSEKPAYCALARATGARSRCP